MLPPPTASALHGTVLTAIGTGIACGTLACGQVITLEDISVEHRVSRSLAREVIRVLESMGMVQSRRRIGITIMPISAWNVFDPRLIRWRLESPDRHAQVASLTELRRSFEPAAAALAARRARAHHCRELATAVSDMQMAMRAGDDAAYRRADSDFHRTVIESSGNEMFRALGELAAEIQGCEQSAEAVDLHDAVARAIRQAAVPNAEAAMRSALDAVPADVPIAVDD